MKKTMKVLFPTDFSDPASDAFQFALILADRWGAEIEVLHVVYPQTEALDIPVMVATATKELIDTGREVIKSFVKTGIEQVKTKLKKSPAITTNIEVGLPEQTIERIAKRDRIDLIIMGSRGENRSGMDKWIGSVATGVVKRATAPVMIIPEESTFREPVRVAYATDIKTGDPFEIWQAIKLLQPLNPEVHIVHVNLNGEDPMDKWEKMEEMKEVFMGQNEISELSFHNLYGQDVEQRLNKFVEANAIDFLVMYQPQRNFWERFFHKSQTKKMALKSKVPLIIQKD